MYEPDFWTNNADVMEMTIEGNRLIARELAELVRDLWHRTLHSLDVAVHSFGHHRPPV